MHLKNTPSEVKILEYHAVFLFLCVHIYSYRVCEKLALTMRSLWWMVNWFFSPLCQFIFMLSVQDWTIVFLQSRSCQLLLALPSFKNGCLAYSGTLNSGRRKIHEKGVLLDLMLALFSAVHLLCLAKWCATGNNALTALVHWPDSVVYSGPPARCSQQAWSRLFQPSNWETQTFVTERNGPNCINYSIILY